MKRFKFISAVVAVILMVGAVSCTTLQGTEDDYYYDRYPQASNRVYVEDPYRGTVVLERDPYSGRYYEVGSYGGNYPAYGYRTQRYGSTYGRGRARVNNNRSYNRNNSYNNNNNNSGNQVQSEQQKKEFQQQKEEARKKILGK